MTNATGNPCGRLCKKHVIVGLILVVAVTACVLAVRCMKGHLPYFGQYHDDALYVVTAKSLAEGAGYKIISLPGAPAQTKYPILYPLLLSILWRLNPRFPANLELFQACGLVLGFSFAVISVLYLLKTRRVTALMSLVILAATLLNIKFLSFLPVTMSDFLFGIFSVMTLWCAERVAGCRGRTSQSSRTVRAAWLAVLAAAAAETRSVAIIIGPLTAVYLLAQRKFRAAALGSAAFIAFVAPLWWWQQISRSQQPPWLSYYTSYSEWLSGAYSALGAATLIGRKAHDIFMSVPKLVWPLLDHMPYYMLEPLHFFLLYRAGFLLLWICLFIGMTRDMSNRVWCLLPLYVTLYGTTMLIWPGFFEWRLALVVLPFMYYFYYCCFRLVSRWIKTVIPRTDRRSWQEFCRFATIMFAIYLIIGAAFPSLMRAGRYPKLLPARTDVAAETEHRDVLATYDWIRSNTAPEAVLVCSNESLLYLYTGRRAVQPSPYEGWRQHSLELVTPDTVTAALRGSGADYLLLDPSFAGAYQAYAQFGSTVENLMSEHPGLLIPVYVSPHRVMFVFHVNRSLLPR